MTFKVIRGQGQAEEMTSVPYRDYFLLLVLAVGAVNVVDGDFTYTLRGNPVGVGEFAGY